MADPAQTVIEFVKDVVETNSSCSCFISIAPQGVSYPYAVIDIISRSEADTQALGSAVDTFRVQVDVFARPTNNDNAFNIAHDAAYAIRTNITRVFDTSNYENIIDGVQEVNHLTDFDPVTFIYRVTNDYLIRVKP
jgi:hypothetical protein